MTLSSLRIATQGFKFPLSAISIAIQGLIDEIVAGTLTVVGGAGGGAAGRGTQKEFEYEDGQIAQLHEEDEMIVHAVVKLIEAGVLE